MLTLLWHDYIVSDLACQDQGHGHAATLVRKWLPQPMRRGYFVLLQRTVTSLEHNHPRCITMTSWFSYDANKSYDITALSRSLRNESKIQLKIPWGEGREELKRGPSPQFLFKYFCLEHGRWLTLFLAYVSDMQVHMNRRLFGSALHLYIFMELFRSIQGDRKIRIFALRADSRTQDLPNNIMNGETVYFITLLMVN